MKTIKIRLFLLFNLFLSNGLVAAQMSFLKSIQCALHDSDYVICIDGGGSKTELQILDSHGDLVELSQNDDKVYSIKAGGSNINV